MPDASTQRLHALDAVRAIALLLGVALHATLSFYPDPPAWMFVDQDRSRTLGALSFLIHTFRMPTFFLVAGFFGRLLLQRLGTDGFVRDRLRRILGPLLWFWPVMVAGFLAAAAVDTYLAGGAPSLGPFPSAPLAGQGLPLQHLWFLYYLLLFYAAALAVRVATQRLGQSAGWMRRLDAGVRWLVCGPWAPLILGLPLFAALALDRGWRPVLGVPTPDTLALPHPTVLAAYLVAFVFGWLVQRQPELLAVWRQRWGLNLTLGGALSVYCLSVLRHELPLEAMPDDMKRVEFVLAFVPSVWLWTFALIGACERFLARRNPVMRYLADASYWIYLAHLPLVVLLQVALAHVPWPWQVKYPLILAIALTLLLASYQGLVRNSRLGALLTGRREPLTP